MNHYKVFTDAAELVERGWIKGTLYDGKSGNYSFCAIGAIGRAQGKETWELPYASRTALTREVAIVVAKRLRRTPTFWLVPFMWGFDPVRKVMCWNDMPWRRQKTVVKLFAGLAQEHAAKHFEDEVFRLSVEVANLKEERKQLLARIEKLEDENIALWKRLLNARSLKSDHDVLAELDIELEEKAQALLHASSAHTAE